MMSKAVFDDKLRFNRRLDASRVVANTTDHRHRPDSETRPSFRRQQNLRPEGIDIGCLFG